MAKFIAAIFLTLVNAITSCRGSCPLDPIEPTLNVTKMSGKWHEYKKTTEFLASSVCTTYEVFCITGACNVNLLPNGTNTGSTNTLITVGESHNMWGKEIIYLNVDSEKQYAFIWNCKPAEDENSEEDAKYELAVLIKSITDEETKKKVDMILENILLKNQLQLEVVNNTLCSGVKKSSMHLPALIILTLTIFIEIYF